MRRIIEWIYPALRWFCRVYGEEVPDWLEGNGWADQLSRTEQEDYFGKAPLRVEEWQEAEHAAGQRG